MGSSDSVERETLEIRGEMILRTPPPRKRRADDSRAPESPGSDRRLVIYEDPVPVSSSGPSEPMLCTYQCRQMVPISLFFFFWFWCVFDWNLAKLSLICLLGYEFWIFLMFNSLIYFE